MAKLESIYISGIRSYGIDERDAQAFDFHSPVTVFLGENGCGKTTIIECIRNALTGDFPNGKTGKFFVADPIIHESSAVKAYIKLTFQDIYGKPAKIMKVLKLEASNEKCYVIGSTYEYCDREGVVRKQSVKQHDCKIMLNMLFGIPEAVLENVLFCHQEDSLWPLSEEDNVKKKFDLLFGSSKYDKAVDVLEKRMIHGNRVLKNLINELDILRDQKNNYEFYKETLSEREKNVNVLNKELDELTEESKVAQHRLDEVIALKESYMRLNGLFLSKEGALKCNQMQQKALKESIKFQFSGSDRELLELLDNADKHYQQKNNQLKQIESKMRSLQAKRDENAKERENCNSCIVRMETQLKMLKGKESDLEYRVDNVLGDESVDNASVNITLIRDKFASEKRELQAAQTACDECEEMLQGHVDAANDEQINVSGQHASKTNELAGVQAAKRKNESDLEAIQNLDERFQNHRVQIDNVEQQIEKLSLTFNETEMLGSIESNKGRRREIEFELECLQTEKDSHDKNALVEKEIAILERESLNKGNQVRKLQDKHFDDLQIVFADIPTSSLLSKVETAHKVHKNNVDSLIQNVREQEICITSIKSVIMHLSEKCESMKEELQTTMREVKNLCGESDFESKLKEVKNQNMRLQTLRGQLTSSQITYKTFIDSLREKKCCPVCDTDFSNNSNTLDKVNTSMNRIIDEIRTQLERIERDLNHSNELQENLFKLSSQNEKIAGLTIVISETSEKIVSRRDLLQAEKNSLKTIRSKLERETLKATTCVKILPIASTIDTFLQEIAASKRKISSLKAKLIPIASKHSQTDTELAMVEKKEDIRRLDENNECLAQKLAAKQKMFNDLQTQKNNLVAAHLELQKSGQGKSQFQEKQRELQQQEVQLRQTIAKLEAEVIAAKTNVAEAKQHLKERETANATKMESLRKKFHALENKIKDIDNLYDEIKLMKNMNLPHECDQVSVKIKHLENADAELVATNQTLVQERDDLRDELNDKDNRVSSMRNEKKLRELQQAEVLLKSALQSVGEEIKGMDYKSIEKEKLELQDKLGNNTYNSSRTKRKLEALNQEVQDIKDELCRYDKNPMKVYLMNMFKFEFIVSSINDNMRSMDAISSAISKFHREQLLSINDRLRELWRETYRGNDIEFIEIQRGETEVTPEKRVYNFSVLQKRAQGLIQMRNKCSAGQKVLACLLIRIALAEHFSAQCGIFALDEPTTNLDRENIRSLSSVLANLIKLHSAKKKLQFLIITHDEEFLEALRTEDVARNCYKVDRNNNGHTYIKLERL